MAKMTDSELKAMLQAERNTSLGGTLTSDLATERSKALDYYNGDMDESMPAGEGQSKAVSRDVCDTVEGLMPTLMEIFEGSEEVVRFNAVGPEDEEAAKQETEYVNYVYSQKNPGFMVSYTFIKDALLSKNGIVKVFWDKSESEERETYLDQPDDAFMMLASSPNTEIVEHTEHQDEQGQTLHDVTLVKRKNYGCVKVVPVPPEEFGVSKFAKSIKDATYCFHQVRKTESDLIAQGFDEDQVKKLPTYTSQEREEDNARNILKEDQSTADKMNRASRLIDTIEHYVLMDYEGNDKPGLYRVTTGGTQLEILKRDGKSDVIAVDEIPFASMTPIIMTHRFFGKSVADLVMDIQEIKTALVRGLLNNVYQLNNQRLEIAESHAGERTLDDLLVNRPGGVVRTKQPGGLIPIPNQPIGTSLYPAIEYMDATREWRTGVTKQGQGLDPNALQNIGERAVLDAASSARAKTKLIARIFAETGFKDMFALIHGCIRKNDRQVNTVRLRGKWVQVDPRNWKTREDMTPNVGLGTGTREQEVGFLMQILNIQKEMLLGGLPTVTPKNVYNASSKIVDRLDLKNPEFYFTDPESPEGQQMAQAAAQRPDPKMIELQMKREDMQAKAQLDERADMRKAEIERLQAEADIATNNKKVEADIYLNERKFELEKELKLIDAQLNREKASVDLQFKAADHEMKSQERKEKAEEAKQPKASIEVKHGADEITGPLAQVVERLGEQMKASQDNNMAALQAVIASKPKKRKIKGPSGKVYEMTEE